MATASAQPGFRFAFHVPAILSLALGLTACTRPPAAPPPDPFTYVEGGIVRGDTARPALALVFTGHEFAEGGASIRAALAERGVQASFFFTGDFYRNPDLAPLIEGLKADGHYLGAHSDKHLLYATWENRDSLLVTHDEFVRDVEDNYREMQRFGIARDEAPYYMPPYEWYNRQISGWTEARGLKIVNFTPGTRSNADYTTPDMGSRYFSSERIFESILAYERQDPYGLNGFILLLHVGTAPERTDKFHPRVGALVDSLQARGYTFARIDALLGRP